MSRYVIEDHPVYREIVLGSDDPFNDRGGWCFLQCWLNPLDDEPAVWIVRCSSSELLLHCSRLNIVIPDLLYRVLRDDELHEAERLAAEDRRSKTPVRSGR